MSKAAAFNSDVPTRNAYKDVFPIKTNSFKKSDITSLAPSKLTPEVEVSVVLAALENYLDAGLLDTAELILRNRRLARVEATEDAEWCRRLAKARERLKTGQTHELMHGVGSAYVPTHPLAEARRKSGHFLLK